MIILTGKTDSYAQFITVLLIFVAVLAVTALVTKWIAGYQKQQGAAGKYWRPSGSPTTNISSWFALAKAILRLRSAKIP